jgi:murein DD-endopeptidase MepM/ murein hydrolase activator NlpD
MSEGVAAAVRRNAFRFALTGLVGIWLSGCADATRFSDSGNPFANPFASASSDSAAPTPKVAATPLATATPRSSGYATAASPSPSAVASAPTPAPDTTGSIRAEPVGGSATGWTAVGGSPIIVGSADDAATLSARYGVPEAALLNANGLHSHTEIHSGMRIVIPIYNAHGQTHVAKADDDDAKGKTHHVAKRNSDDDDSDDGRKADRAETSHKKHKTEAKSDDGDKQADDERSEKKAGKSEKIAKAEKSEKAAKAEKSEKAEKTAKAEKSEKTEKAAKADKPEKGEKKAGKSEKTADAAKSDAHAKDAGKTEKAAKPAPEVAKAEPAKQPKKAETDNRPTGNVPASDGDAAKTAENGQFRWPARGRIIQGFKAGGNDGINIALPEGTSVRATEDGKVAYAGSALKGYGNLVLIRHSNGFVSAYANNGELDVKSGDTVKRGQVIAKSGQTGDVSTPQLHFELRKGQTPVDPTNYLAGL